jgi:hypothetical protein
MLGVTAATKSGIGYEHRAVCWPHEARQALVISVARVTAIMLIANLILIILY